MRHTKVIFGKEIIELTLNDIEGFFSNKREENINLEFKSYVDKGDYASKELSIKKTVCAMLNAEGGIIIWGAPLESRDKDNNTYCNGELTPFETSLDRDRLINILSASIIPMPIGIEVNVLRNSENKAVIIVEIEKSVYRPHQFNNHYYIRLDGQTKIAPHYLISALMKSVEYPNIEGYIRMKNISIHNGNLVIKFNKLIINRSELNNEINPYSRILTATGSIFINGSEKGSNYFESWNILTQGMPSLSTFIILIPHSEIRSNIKIGIQFGGDKSPSKVSTYEYNLPEIVTGEVSDESIYLIHKSENDLPNASTYEEYNNFVNDLLNE